MTRRQEIIEILSKEEKSAHELANYFKVEMPEILEDVKNHQSEIGGMLLLLTMQVVFDSANSATYFPPIIDMAEF